MSSKLTRAQVLADFKLNIYPSLRKLVGDKFNEISEYWNMNLKGHLVDKNITESQCNNWKLKESELK